MQRWLTDYLWLLRSRVQWSKAPECDSDLVVRVRVQSQAWAVTFSPHAERELDVMVFKFTGVTTTSTQSHAVETYNTKTNSRLPKSYKAAQIVQEKEQLLRKIHSIALSVALAVAVQCPMSIALAI